MIVYRHAGMAQAKGLFNTSRIHRMERGRSFCATKASPKSPSW